MKVRANVCDWCKEVWNASNMQTIQIGTRTLSFCPDCCEEYSRVMEIKTAYWIKRGINKYECSECHNREGMYSYYRSKYCADCGALMVVGGREDD